MRLATRNKNKSKSFIYKQRFIALALFALSVSACRSQAIPPPPAAPPVVEEPSPPPAPSMSLGAQPTSIERGMNATLRWRAQNADEVRIEPGIGVVASRGMRDVSPSSSVTYTATAVGPGGSTSDTVRVTVSVPEPPATVPPLPSTPELTIEELFRANTQPVLFDYDRSEIRADQVSRLQSNARFLVQNVGLLFTVSGHADERGSQEYNIGLGDLRANAVRAFLIEQGVAGSRINTVSFGEERPVCREETEACYQANRRAAFVTNQ